MEGDLEYQKLIKNKRKKLSEETKVSQKEKAKYVLSDDKDFEILKKCKLLSKKKLSNADKELVILIKEKLEDEWRKPLIKILNNLLKKYK